jgi:hypothetical protein
LSVTAIVADGLMRMIWSARKAIAILQFQAARLVMPVGRSGKR